MGVAFPEQSRPMLAALVMLVAGCGEERALTETSDPERLELVAELREHFIPTPGGVTPAGSRDPWSCEESPACMSLLDEGAVGAGRMAAVRDSLIDNLPPLRR